MISLSAVIITFNEENRIADCIQSLKNVADEILVLDSQSTDRTEEICTSLGVTFYSRLFEGYSGSKNYANQLAKYDFILSLDADEQLSEELKSEILKFKNWANEFDAASFNRLTNYCGQWIKHGGWYPDKKIRIFNRNWAAWKGQIHESLQFDSRVKVTHLPKDCYHYSFESLQDHLSKIENYSTLASQDLFAKKIKASYLKLYFSPVIKFLKIYFLKLGFLDGRNGYFIAFYSAYDVYIKYLKLFKLYQNA